MNNFLCKAFIVILISAGTLKSQVLSPIAHFKFNGDVKDDSPYGNHGRIVGYVESTSDRFGNKNGALYFFGDGNSYIEVPNSPSLESPESQITITGWFKLKSHNYSNYWLTMLCKGDKTEETSANPQYRFQISQNYKPQFSSCSPNVEAGYSVISLNSEALLCDPEFLNRKFEPNKWHFYAVSYNGNQISIYYDGFKTLQYPFSSKLISNSSPLLIGRDNPGIIDDFRGALDDIRIYDSSLSDLEIYSIFSETESDSFYNKSKFKKTSNLQ